MILRAEQAQTLIDWFQSQGRSLCTPPYSSFDIRQFGNKMAPIDANLYPAGFNNIHPLDRRKLPRLWQNFFKNEFPNVKKILLVAEEHTLNTFYWDNVHVLSNSLKSAGFQVLLAIPREAKTPIVVESHSYGKMEVVGGHPSNPQVQDFQPDLILSNNDFSSNFLDWRKLWDIPIIPPVELGWYQRRKSNYFAIYNRLAEEMAKLIDVDPFWITIRTETHPLGDVDNPDDRAKLADKAKLLFLELEALYKNFKIPYPPTLFIKNNSGTYGLAVTKVSSAEEILNWSWKARKKLKAAKGGRPVQEVILQEGIPSEVTYQGQVAEKVIYFIGSDPAGEFLRVHPEKSHFDSLNSPGSHFVPFNLEPSEPRKLESWLRTLSIMALMKEVQVLFHSRGDCVKVGAPRFAEVKSS